MNSSNPLSIARQSMLALAACLLCAGGVQAATWSGEANFSTCTITATSGGWNSCGATVPGVEVSAVVTKSDGKTYNGVIVPYGSGGLGANWENGSTGPHSVDSIDGLDAIVLNFGSSSVDLNKVTVGWNGRDNGGTTAYQDSDLSVYRWNGASAPVLPTTSTGVSNFLSSWTLVGEYGNVGNRVSNTATFEADNSFFSSYWLVSALGGSSGNSCGVAAKTIDTRDKCADAFKLLSVAGNFKSNSGGGSVPEPGSLALLGLGALGLVASRRRVKVQGGV